MAGEKIIKFLGKIPKISPELLPETAGQVATNCKLYSGDLIPYPEPVVSDTTGLTAEPKTIYPLRNTDGSIEWRSWDAEVNVVLGPTVGDNEQRIYYTGDGVPKVTTYDLASVGESGGAPEQYYELGLPYPTDTPSVAVTEFSPILGFTYSRDASGVVTMTKSGTDHGLRDGLSITISGFSYRSITYAAVAASAVSGTFSQAEDSLSAIVHITDHRLSDGQIVELQFDAPNDTFDGAYQAVIIDANSFAVTFSSAAARSGDVDWVNKGANELTVTLSNHGLVVGDVVPLVFTTGDATSGSYPITAVTTNTFTVDKATSRPTEGDGRLDLTSLNAQNARCTVIDDETFTYFAPGFQLTNETTDAGIELNLGNTALVRSYTYTWLTAWNEESIAATPTDDVVLKDGEVATLSGLPTSPPAGNNFVRGIRIYRTLTSGGAADYFRLRTAWFPTSIVAAYRKNNLVRVTLGHPHNQIEDDWITISGSPLVNGEFKIGKIVDAYTFRFYSAGADVASAPGGTVTFNVGTQTDRDYFDDGTFVDDIDPSTLVSRLVTDNYDAPPEDLQGLVAIQNGILMGFVRNILCFSELGEQHAWPVIYQRAVEPDVVALVPAFGSVYVLTTAAPYFVSGSDPATLSVQRIDSPYPCLSARSVVALESGILYATHGGMALIGFGGQGLLLSTKNFYDNNTWRAAFDPSSIVGTYFAGQYVASHSTGGFVLDQSDQENATFVDTTLTFSAAYYDAVSGYAYVTAESESGVYDILRWDDETQPLTTLEWKSKVIKIPSYTNLGAARVIADYAPSTTTWSDVDTTWDATTDVWNAPSPVVFKLWANKQLIYTKQLSNDRMFRLPTGYRTDTYEFGIESNVRVRAIHIGETPHSLKES